MIDRVPPNNPGLPLSGLMAYGQDDDSEGGILVELPDGGAEVQYGEQEPAISIPFEANLAEYLPRQTLQSLASDLQHAVDEDKNSRSDWELALTQGLDLLGIRTETRTTPWPGACGVVHPMILEAAVRFQSKSVTKLFPPEGPANCKVVGEADQERLRQAQRVKDDLNHWLCDLMPEYREETEQLLFALPVDGSAFRKTYYDPLLKRPVAQFVPASDFLMPYGFPNLETCPRYTHVMRQAYSDVRRLQQRGFYRDISLSETVIQLNPIEEKVAKIGGFEPSYSRNELLTLHEVHADLMFPELGDSDEPCPYIVTIEQSSNTILAVRRNWREGDEEKKKILYFTHYRYVPWKGAYGLGLIHLIGGISKGSTSILRQLVDAGTLANLPGGLKTRGMRVKGDDDPIAPGEWRDVDIPAGKIGDCVFPLPYKEPSAVLFQLLQLLVTEGKSFASIAELEINSSSQNAPVGTMLALIERATEVITAVQARLHRSLGCELNILYEIIRDCTPPVYDYDPVNAPKSAKGEDYETQMTIVPVSDPASATMAQRVMEYQAALQLSATAPQLYDLPLLHRSMLQVLGIDNADQIVPDKGDIDPADPVAENMHILTSKPVKVFEWQDHAAHLACHQSFLQDPKIQQGLGQTPLAASIMSAAQAHIAEHMAYQYRQSIEAQIGVPLPASGTKLPPEIEEQMSGLMASAAQKLLAQNQAQVQAAQAQQQAQDPMLQLQQQELQVKQQTAQAKAASDAQKLQLEQAKLAQKTQSDQAKLVQKAQSDQARVESGDRQTAARVQGETTQAMIRAGISREEIASRERQALAGLSSKERQGAIDHLVNMQENQADRDNQPPAAPETEGSSNES